MRIAHVVGDCIVRTDRRSTRRTAPSEAALETPFIDDTHGFQQLHLKYIKMYVYGNTSIAKWACPSASIPV